MPNSASPSSPEAPHSEWLERLTDAVNTLANEARVVRDALDEVREELSWITRNGIPSRGGEHLQLVRLARDPFAEDAIERLESVVSAIGPNYSSESSPELFDELVSEIAEVVTVVGQEQANLLLSALDDTWGKLVAAIKASAVTQITGKEPAASEASQTSGAQAPVKPSETRSLF